VLRPGHEGDAAALAAVFTASVHHVAAGHYDAAQRAAWAPAEPDTAWWRERLAELSVCVAERDGILAGFIAYTGDGYIDLLFTAPGHTRQGVASHLYAAAEASLREAGVRVLATHASLLARPFFESRGFHVVAPELATRGDQQLKRFAMAKTL
jgi:putative acetyltransferase